MSPDPYEPGNGPGGEQIVLGEVTVTRVPEYVGTVEMTPAQFFPDSSPGSWEAHRDWLAPDFWDPVTDQCRSAIQTWVLRSAGRTILVDTGVGDDKERPYSPVWSRRESRFLERLAHAGVRPDDVDVVVNTHLHVDHVGWNTVLADRAWVPTFPNATYLMPRADVEFWDPAHERRSVLGRGNQNVFEDSVAPVLAAGLAEPWDGSYRIDENLCLELAPGHTPGSSVLALDSRGEHGLFVGDLMHTGLQVVEPDVNSCFCEDPVEARASRHRLLSQASETGAVVFPAHFTGSGAAEVTRDGARFAIKNWAGFSRLT